MPSWQHAPCLSSPSCSMTRTRWASHSQPGISAVVKFHIVYYIIKDPMSLIECIINALTAISYSSIQLKQIFCSKESKPAKWPFVYQLQGLCYVQFLKQTSPRRWTNSLKTVNQRTLFNCIRISSPPQAFLLKSCHLWCLCYNSLMLQKHWNEKAIIELFESMYTYVFL